MLQSIYEYMIVLKTRELEQEGLNVEAAETHHSPQGSPQ